MRARLVSVAAVVLWAVSGPTFGAGDADFRCFPYWHLDYRCIQNEINISSVQAKQIEGLVKQLDDAVWEHHERFPFPNVENLPENEGIRQTRGHLKLSLPRYRKMLADFLPRFENVLDAQQRHRLQQVGWQLTLREALRDHSLWDAMDLPNDRRAQLSAVYDQFKDKEDHLLSPGNSRSGSPKLAQTIAQMERLYPDWEHAMVQVLTKAEKKKLDGLLGKPFDVSLFQKEAASRPMQVRQFKRLSTPEK
jgi:hypothetical protein